MAMPLVPPAPAVSQLSIPDLRRRLHAEGYPSDLRTALLVRTAARKGLLTWTHEALRTLGEHALHLVPESK